MARTTECEQDRAGLERKAALIDSKIRGALAQEGREATKENLWKGALSVFAASANRDGRYLGELLHLLNANCPEELGGQCVRIKDLLLRCEQLYPEKGLREDKDFYTLLLKTGASEAVLEDQEYIGKVMDLLLHSSPKARKRAVPTMRKIISRERGAGPGATSRSFDRLLSIAERFVETEEGSHAKMVSVLGNFHQEIAELLQEERACRMARQIVDAGEGRGVVAALYFLGALLRSSAGHAPDLYRHLDIANACAEQGVASDDAGPSALLVDYYAEIFKRSASASLLHPGGEFLVSSEGSETERVLGDYMQLVLGKETTLDQHQSIKRLLGSLRGRIFPCFKKLVGALASSCRSKKDPHLEKEIEVVIGEVGPEKFMKAINNQDFLHWLPMMRAGINNSDVGVFCRRFLPEIQKARSNPRQRSAYEQLWGCFPSFCRRMQDSEGVLSAVLDEALKGISDKAVRGPLSHGVQILVEEALGAELHVARGEGSARHIAALAGRADLFEAIAFHHARSPGDNEKLALGSLLKVLDAEWQDRYFAGIIGKAFPGMDAGENPGSAEIEKEFVRHAQILQLAPRRLIGNELAEAGVLRYCLSAQLKAQRAGYKLLLCMAREGYGGQSLLDFLTHADARSAMFPCARHYRVEILYVLLRRLGQESGVAMCQLVCEVVALLKEEGGKNRKTGYDIVTDMAGRYPTPVLDEMCKMAVAGIPSGDAPFSAGCVHLASALLFAAKERVSPAAVDCVFDACEALTNKKAYQIGKALVGFFAVLLADTPYRDRYIERSFRCLDTLLFHYKAQLKNNLRTLFRRVSERRDVAQYLSPHQKDFFKSRGRRFAEEKESRLRVVTRGDGRIEVQGKRGAAPGAERKRERARARPNKKFKK